MRCKTKYIFARKKATRTLISYALSACIECFEKKTFFILRFIHESAYDSKKSLIFQHIESVCCVYVKLDSVICFDGSRYVCFIGV